MVAAYPEVEGLPWQIVLDCQTGPLDPRRSGVIVAGPSRNPKYGGNLIVQWPGRTGSTEHTGTRRVQQGIRLALRAPPMP